MPIQTIEASGWATKNKNRVFKKVIYNGNMEKILIRING